MTGADVALLLAGAVALTGAALAVASRVLLHAVSMWALSLLGVAGVLVGLGSPVVGGLHLLTGLVAAGVVLMVTAAVTRAPFDRHDDFDVSWARRAGALGSAVAVAALLAVALVETVGWHAVPKRPAGTLTLALGVLATWWWAFLMAVLGVVAALVAALFLARTEGEP